MNQETRSRIEAIGLRRAELIQELNTKPSGLSWCERHTELCDTIVSLIFADAQSQLDQPANVAIIATGGYGRRELCPYSDIDITVVPNEQDSTELDKTIRALFQDLHWAFSHLKMDVGYAYRLVSDAPGLDAKTRTGLLDMRLISGNPELFHQLDNALHETFAAGEFILSKIEERRHMYDRHNDTPLVVEPHLKEGAGGLRDFHCANWLREAIDERPSRPTPAYDTLMRYRNLLHLCAGKAQDFLSRSRQAEIADRLKVDVFQMMPEVISAAEELNRSFRTATEKLKESRFSLSEGALAIKGEVRVMPEADPGEASVGVAIATQLGLSVNDLPIKVRNSVHGPAALLGLSTGEPTLRNLDKCGLLRELLPELDACKTLVPDDNVHVFTVYEHSLRVVRYLDSIEHDGFLGELKSQLNDTKPLYLAAILHDIGKIDPTRSHSDVGAEMADKICKRWNLAPNITEAVVWLIQEHLTMARFIRIRDVMNPETVEEFAQIVTDPDRLAMLALLTWADVNAVNATAWTQAQETFLKYLYDRTLLRLQGELLQPADPAQTRHRLLRQLKDKHVDGSKVQEFLESLPAHYLTSTPSDVVQLHMALVDRAKAGETTVELFMRPELSATDLTVCSLDSPGLLSKLLGVLYAFDLSVGGIRACTTNTDPAVALDVFTVSFNGRPVPGATSTKVAQAIQNISKGQLTLDELLTSRGKDPARHQRIFRHTYVPGSPGILEIRAPRGRGMPFRFSRLLAEQGWNIVAARVGQWAGNAAGAFYITGPDGKTLTPEVVDRILLAETDALEA